MLHAVAGVVSLQATLLVLLGVAVRERDVAATVNAAGVVAGAAVLTGMGFVPGWSDAVGPALPLWFSLAGALHVVGMLGAYESTWWWDHLTHTVSAAMVGAVVYAGVLVLGPPWSTSVAAAVTVAATFVIGVAWELAEVVAREVGERFDVEPVLVVYGRWDTVMDLVFDVVGAVLVVVADVRVFVDLVERVA